MDVRPIDADALLTVPNVNWVYQYDETGEYIKYKAIPVEAIEKAPTLDLAPVVHGEWIENDTPFTRQRRCSVCGQNDNHKTAIKGKFCWYCGAKMDGGKKDETN